MIKSYRESIKVTMGAAWPPPHPSHTLSFLLTPSPGIDGGCVALVARRRPPNLASTRHEKREIPALARQTQEHPTRTPATQRLSHPLLGAMCPRLFIGIVGPARGLGVLRRGGGGSGGRVTRGIGGVGCRVLRRRACAWRRRRAVVRCQLCRGVVLGPASSPAPSNPIA